MKETVKVTELAQIALTLRDTATDAMKAPTVVDPVWAAAVGTGYVNALEHFMGKIAEIIQN